MYRYYDEASAPPPGRCRRQHGNAAPPWFHHDRPRLEILRGVWCGQWRRRSCLDFRTDFEVELWDILVGGYIQVLSAAGADQGLGEGSLLEGVRGGHS